MLRGLYTSVSSMITLQQRQSVITNDLANINTNGYKSETLVSKSFDEVLLSNKDNYQNGVANKQILGSMSFGVSIDDTVTNFSQGVHTLTDNNSDFSIDGKGFFQVQDIDGNTYYTRDGSFNINDQGYLITKAGYNVMGTNKFSGNLEPINNIDNYSFSIVDFEDYNELKKVGLNVYSGKNPVKSNDFYIKQGYIENSNVDSINTTSLLLQTVKEFEANQKIIQTVDSTLNKIANEIGAV